MRGCRACKSEGARSFQIWTPEPPYGAFRALPGIGPVRSRRALNGLLTLTATAYQTIGTCTYGLGLQRSGVHRLPTGTRYIRGAKNEAKASPHPPHSAQSCSCISRRSFLKESPSLIYNVFSRLTSASRPFATRSINHNFSIPNRTMKVGFFPMLSFVHSLTPSPIYRS